MAATKGKTASSNVKKVGPKKTSKASKKPSKITPTTQKTAKLSIGAIDKAFTKSKLYSTLAEAAGLKRSQIVTLFDNLKHIINAHLKKQGPGKFTVPGLVKMTVNVRPATKARKGTNTFTGEEMTFKAKPARKVVKVRALKELKNLVAQGS